MNHHPARDLASIYASERGSGHGFADYYGARNWVLSGARLRPMYYGPNDGQTLHNKMLDDRVRQTPTVSLTRTHDNDNR